MMNRKQIEMLLDLREAIAAWLEENPHPTIGENVDALMARAALSVLFAVEDTEAYLKETGLWKEEE